MEIEWDENALRKMTDDIVREQANQLQVVLDRVLQLAKGKTAEEVKVLLEREWRTGLGGVVTDPELSEYADTLAAGQRIVVTPETAS